MPKAIIRSKKFSIKSRPLRNYYNILAGSRTIMAGRLSGEIGFEMIGYMLILWATGA